MSHPSFIPTKPEDSPFYNASYMELFHQVRQITSYVRPGGNHGCKLTEIIPGLWTAHFEDISEADVFSSNKLSIVPPIGLVVNSAVAYNQCPTYQGYYGPDIHVLPVSLYDDPKTNEPHKFAGDALQYFEIVNQSIEKTIKGGESVIIHCYASLSRSVCFIIAYLMYSRNLSILEATSFLKFKWDATYPNDSFVFQLIEYSKILESRRNNDVLSR